MLSTFTKLDGGTIIIRSEDIKRIETEVNIPAPTSILIWVEGEYRESAVIQGTALENLAHIQREELDGIDRVASYQEAQQRRQMAGMPAVPVPRGKMRASTNA